MKIARNVMALLLLALTIQGCQTNNGDRNANAESGIAGKELVLRGQVSVPLPETYERVLLDEHAMIITGADYSVVYRWIDQEEIEFIGSDKSPYHFFSSVFNQPESNEEKRFLEGLTDEVRQPSSPSNLEFYYFNNGSGRQLYILSSSLSFVVEITYKGDGEMYINRVITHSALK